MKTTKYTEVTVKKNYSPLNEGYAELEEKV